MAKRYVLTKTAEALHEVQRLAADLEFLVTVLTLDGAADIHAQVVEVQAETARLKIKEAVSLIERPISTSERSNPCPK